MTDDTDVEVEVDDDDLLLRRIIQQVVAVFPDVHIHASETDAVLFRPPKGPTWVTLKLPWFMCGGRMPFVITRYDSRGPMMFNVPDEDNAVTTLVNIMREAGWSKPAEPVAEDAGGEMSEKLMNERELYEQLLAADVRVSWNAALQACCWSTQEWPAGPRLLAGSSNPRRDVEAQTNPIYTIIGAHGEPRGHAGTTEEAVSVILALRAKFQHDARQGASRWSSQYAWVFPMAESPEAALEQEELTSEAPCVDEPVRQRDAVLAFIESALDREGYDCTDLKEAITALIVERDQAHKEVETLREEQRALRDAQSQMQAAISDVHVVLEAAGVPNNGMPMVARVAWLAGRVGDKA